MIACFGEIQTVLVSAGIVSGILWPKPDRRRTAAQRAASEARGKRLCTALGVHQASPLNDKVLRNSVEHIDERFEDHYARHGPGPHPDFSIVVAAPPGYVFPPSAPRGYVVPTNEVWLFGDRRDLQAIALAMWNLADSFSVPITLRRAVKP